MLKYAEITAHVQARCLVKDVLCLHLGNEAPVAVVHIIQPPRQTQPNGSEALLSSMTSQVRGSRCPAIYFLQQRVGLPVQQACCRPANKALAKL